MARCSGFGGGGPQSEARISPLADSRVVTSSSVSRSGFGGLMAQAKVDLVGTQPSAYRAASSSSSKRSSEMLQAKVDLIGTQPSACSAASSSSSRRLSEMLQASGASSAQAERVTLFSLPADDGFSSWGSSSAQGNGRPKGMVSSDLRPGACEFTEMCANLSDSCTRSQSPIPEAAVRGDTGSSTYAKGLIVLRRRSSDSALRFCESSPEGVVRPVGRANSSSSRSSIDSPTKDGSTGSISSRLRSFSENFGEQAASKPRLYRASSLCEDAVQQEATMGIAGLPALLGDRDRLKKQVVKCFRAVAGSSRGIDGNELWDFRANLSRLLDLPEAAFGDIEESFQRYDFNGNGLLEPNEAYKLVKFSLYEYMKHINAHPQIEIPSKSLDSAGLRVTREVGAGSQGVVKLATDSMGNERCVKCYAKEKMDVEALKQEFEALKLAACEHVVRVDDIFQDAHFYYLVEDAMQGGDFTTVQMRAEQVGVNMGEDWYRGLFKQCFEALKFMHEQALLHCDIKEPNLMCKSLNFQSPHVMVIDFGVSMAMSKVETGIIHGTPGYVPPETWKLKKWFARGDIFSMGVVIVQMLTGRIPESSSNLEGKKGIFQEFCQSVADIRAATFTRQPPVHEVPFPALSDLCDRCLAKLREGRPKAPQVLKDQWFQAPLQTKATAVKC